MKALVIADHNPHIDVLRMVEAESIDLIITLGDLTREDILTLAQVRTIPKIGVYGNHDSGQYMEELGIWNMHLMTWTYMGKTFGGFEGCVRYKENPDAIMYTQNQANQLMISFPRVDIFISHCPPRGINDEEEIAHRGFDALRAYLDIQSPHYWLHGHTYPGDDALQTQHNATRIEYVSKYRIVNLS